MTGPTVLFQAHDRQGLGHLVRGLALADEILQLAPDARVLVHARDAAAASFCPPSVRCVVESGPGTGWRDVLAATAPDLVVHDTRVPEDPAAEPLPRHTRVGVVLRRSRPEQHAGILAGGLLDRSDAVVVPHARREFDLPLPDGVLRRTCFAGPIARRPDPRHHDWLRHHYEIGPEEALLVSTVGEGGFARSPEPFLAAVREVQAALTRVPRPVRHVVVLGPHHPGPVPEIPGATVVDVEPCLVDLFALADLVVTEGGHSTVCELRGVGAPAVFLPGDRRPDDELERLRALSDLGLGCLVEDAAPGAPAAAVTGLLSAPGRLEEMRRRAAALPVALGNRAAAEHLLGPLLRPRRAA